MGGQVREWQSREGTDFLIDLADETPDPRELEAVFQFRFRTLVSLLTNWKAAMAGLNSI